MSAIVNCVAYVDGCRAAQIDLNAIGTLLQQPGQFVWIGLHEPDEELLAQVQSAFGLHDLAIEDAHHAHQRPKLEIYDHSLFVVLRTAQAGFERAEIEFGETHIFVGERYLVSVRHGPSRSYADVRARCEATPRLLRQGSGFVLYALMDAIVDQYFPVIEALEEEFEALEDQIFSGRIDRRITGQIYDLKRNLLVLKRAVSPLIDICNRLVRFDHELIPMETSPYFRDVYDHVIRINEMVDNMRELLTTALEANFSLISITQNEVMKRFAGWAAIIAMPTMIAGIYGMNFEFMPELHWPLGYPVVLLLIVSSCAILFTYFRRSGWI